MKKYVFIIPSFASGGAERAVVNLSSQLAKDGCDVAVIIYFSMPKEYAVDSRVKVINLSGGDEKKYKSISYPRKILMLRKILIEENPDYIFPFLPQITIHSTIAGFDMHQRIIHTIRNNPALTPSNKFKRRLCNYIVCKSGKTIVQNNKQRAYFPPKYREKMHVLFNPVSNDWFNICREHKTTITTVIGVGRLEEQKNFSMLIETMPEILKNYPDVKLKIYGEGSLRERLQTQINDLKLCDSVQLMGRCHDMKKAYQDADLFVLPSNFEGMPNTLIEAMASGLPCVSTDCETGPADLIDGKNGFLIPVEDKEELVKKISMLLNDPQLAYRMGELARKTVQEKCGVETIVSRLRQICEY